MFLALTFPETKLRPQFDSRQWQWWDSFFSSSPPQTGSGAHSASYTRVTERSYPGERS